MLSRDMHPRPHERQTRVAVNLDLEPSRSDLDLCERDP
jgi:hypothetical protein